MPLGGSGLFCLLGGHGVLCSCGAADKQNSVHSRSDTVMHWGENEGEGIWAQHPPAT